MLKPRPTSDRLAVVSVAGGRGLQRVFLLPSLARGPDRLGPAKRAVGSGPECWAMAVDSLSSAAARPAESPASVRRTPITSAG